MLLPDWMFMPKMISVYNASTYEEYELEDSLHEGYLAFAYPGKFLGFGDSWTEALVMARMRLRNQRTKFLEDHTEEEWAVWACKRTIKMNEVHSRFGIKKQSTWNADDVDKT